MEMWWNLIGQANQCCDASRPILDTSKRATDSITDDKKLCLIDCIIFYLECFSDNYYKVAIHVI